MDALHTPKSERMTRNMRTPSVVDDILTSISRLPFPQPDISSQSTALDAASTSLSDGRPPTSPINHVLNLPPSATKDAQSLLLTLHFLFPHELLPAIDLLDRGLVINLISTNASASSNDLPHGALESNTYYVQSASATADHHPTRSGLSSGESQASGRFRNAMAGRGKSKLTQTYYEVRLDGWNCSCAAFAFTAFTGLVKDTVSPDREGGQEIEGEVKGNGKDDTEGGDEGEEGKHWGFGGTLTQMKVGVPVCKHILAALMVRVAPTFFDSGKNLRVQDAGREEMAGWGAGWGEGV